MIYYSFYCDYGYLGTIQIKEDIIAYNEQFKEKDNKEVKDKNSQ